MRNGPSQTEPVVGRGPAAQLVDEDEAVTRRRSNDRRGLQHFWNKKCWIIKTSQVSQILSLKFSMTASVKSESNMKTNNFSLELIFHGFYINSFVHA